jgi:hypothetical protein
MTTNVRLNNQIVEITGTNSSLSISENFGLFGNQGFTITSLTEIEALVNALKVELATAWPGIKLTLDIPVSE